MIATILAFLVSRRAAAAYQLSVGRHREPKKSRCAGCISFSELSGLACSTFSILVGVPLFGALDPAVRTKIYAPLMSRAMSWFRWSAMITVLVGLRYFTIILKADAVNAGRPSLLWTWFGEWFGIWMVAYAIIYALTDAVGRRDQSARAAR